MTKPLTSPSSILPATPTASSSTPRDLGRVLDALLDGVVVVDARGCVERFNAEACRMLETSSEAAAGRPVEQVPGASIPARLARAALAGGTSAVEHEQTLSRRFAPPLVVDVAASPLLDEDGRVDGAVVVLRDRTIGTALRELWSERRLDAAWGRIAAGLAHEVKNPLGGIRGAAELLAARSGDTKGRETAELIVREVDRIAGIVDELLVFARGEAPQLAPVNLHRVLDDVLAVLGHDALSARARIVRRFDPSIPELLADAKRLTQVFLNLARNALEALPASGGRLRVTTRLRVDHRLAPSDGPHVPGVTIEFEDSGPGIPPDVLEQVGTPFFTTKVGGSGLGVALARHFLALHGGTLQLQSEPGRGTRARVMLPLRRPA